MYIDEFEKRRARNIVWNIASDYSFQPEILAYDDEEKADLYLNCIIGALHKYYDWDKLMDLVKSVGGGKDGEYCEALLWVGFENCAYQKEIEMRPALYDLRQDYAKKRVAQIKINGILSENVESAHYKYILKREVKLSKRECELLKGIEFDASMDTDSIVEQAKEVLGKFFKIAPYEEDDDTKSVIKFIPFLLGANSSSFMGKVNENWDFGFGYIRNDKEMPKEKSGKKHKLFRIGGKNPEQVKAYIEGSFGLPIYDESKQNELENKLCTANHSNCHIHFTKGEYGSIRTEKSEEAIKQRKENENYYKVNEIQHENNIIRLTDRIRNALLIYREPDIVRSVAGNLQSGKIWRNIYLDDQRIFEKIVQEDKGDISIDLLLDSSSSQQERQKEIASQGYMIAEALTRCDIPTRVYSFCSLSGYTVINFFRDYMESDGNKNIFRYFAAGWNRDGLAIRTARYIMEDSPCRNKILIILSDVNPNDDGKFPSDNYFKKGQDYGGKAGVEDTALEVRRAQKEGISVLCVFTGKEWEIPNAKKIYGRDFASIRSLNQFADAVGILIQNRIRDL